MGSGPFFICKSLMKIKEATKAEIPAIRKLAEASWRDNYRNLLSPDQIEYMLKMMYSEEELQNHFSQTTYPYYIIRDSGKPVGFLGFEYDFEPGTTKLHRIYLLQECKGLGFGKLALDFLKEKVRSYGNSRIILNVNKGNPARGFYTTQGFTVYDEGVFDIGNGFVMDDVLMEFFV